MAAYAVAGAVAVTYLAMLGPVVTAAQAATVTFASTGTEQVFGVPAGVRSVHVVAVGGRGGNTFTSGGFGAVAIADLAVTPGQTLYVEVAGNGQDRASGAGFNGGGAGGPEPYGVDGAGGGGASDVRTLTASDPDSLWSRLIVAGGGGGGSAWGTGGAAGQPGAGILNLPFGGTTLVGGGPGTATAGGAGGQAWYSPPGEGGRLGQGGTGAAWGSSGGGGGGGGLYGGGGGAGELQTCGNTCTSLGPGGGGGGSSGFDTTATNGSVGNDQTGVATVAIGYTEPPPPSTLTVSRARAQAGGAITVTANVSSAGRLNGAASTKVKRRGSRPRTFRYGTASVTVDTSRTTALRLQPTKLAKRLLVRHRRLTVSVAVTFIPADGGTRRTKTVSVVVHAASLTR